MPPIAALSTLLIRDEKCSANTYSYQTIPTCVHVIHALDRQTLNTIADNPEISPSCSELSLKYSKIYIIDLNPCEKNTRSREIIRKRY